MLDADQARRYARHIVLRGFGGTAQQALGAARIGIVGAGGLGSPVIAYLAAAGVGQLDIFDDDSVSVSNLQRQIVHRSDGIGVPKAESAAAYVRALNPTVVVKPHSIRLSAANAPALLSGADVIIDGSDRISTRRLSACAAEAARKPLVCGAVSMFDGQVTVIAPHLTRPDGRPAPRLADLYPDALGDDDQLNCELAGILGPVTGVIGTLMALEAIKLVTGIGDPLIGRLLVYESLPARFSEIEI